MIGRGTQRIVEDCRKARLKEPKWTSSSLETSLTFFSPTRGGQQVDINERQTKILAAMKSKTSLKASDVAELLGGEAGWTEP